MTAGPITQGGAVFAVATRITALDPNGFPAVGYSTITTNALVKCTLTPVLETGDDIAIKGASGDLIVAAKHGDMIKYATISIEFATPDTFIEQLLAGGTVYSDTSAALGVPTGLTLTALTTGGSLAGGVYAYRATQYDAYGETLAESEVQVTVTGPTGQVVLSGVTPSAGALGIRYYGRLPGQEVYLGSQPVIGTQATAAASGTGSITSLTVTALTKPMPIGTTFTISGDTNTPKVVFTVSATTGIGAVALPVQAVTVTITIAAGTIQPVFVDTGAIALTGAGLPTADLSGGPGTGVGYQAPLLLPVANPQGVSVELYSKRYKGGVWATDYPYIRTVLPQVRNLHIMPRDVTNANMQSVFEGEAFENPNWGSGPFGDWQFDSTKWVQRAVCGAQILPVAGVGPGAAAY